MKVIKDILDIPGEAVKLYLQERRAKKTTEYYKRQVIKDEFTNVTSDISTVLRKRLYARGINPRVKRKGDLHIFLVFPLLNWERVLPLCLQPFGKVTVFEWNSLGFDDCSPDWLESRKTMNSLMLDAFQDAHSEHPIDAVVGYLAGYNTDPEILDEMGKAGVVIFNFCWDDKVNFPGKIVGGRYTSPAAIASAVDLNLTNAPDSIIKYLAHGGLAMFWPEAAHPDIHKPYDVPFTLDVSFIGRKYSWRPRFIDRLRRRGIKITALGPGWENGSLSDKDMIRTYSTSRINLGFAGVGYSRKLMCLKGRDFEVPMSGGLYLTQDNPELGLVYEVGKEIVTYRDEDDCARKIRWLLEKPDEADKIRKAGRTRALGDHSWENRFSSVFRLAGLLEDE